MKKVTAPLHMTGMRPGATGAVDPLESENALLRQRIAQLEESLRAIRGSEVDALYVSGAGGDRLFTLNGADRAYRLLVEEMGEGALTLTPAGVVLYANRRFAEMLGRQHLPSVIGSPIGSPWPSKNRTEIIGLPPAPPRTGCLGI